MNPETTAKPQPSEVSVLAGLKPWDLWDRPFVYETEDLNTFLLFLKDEETREYELSNLTACSLSSVLYTTSVLNINRDKRYTLYGVLLSYPERMPRFLRKKLSSRVGWFFSLKQFQ